MADNAQKPEVATETQKSKEELERGLETNVVEQIGLLGTVDITQLFRKHTDVNYSEWVDLYKTGRVQATMRTVLVESGCSPKNVGEFLKALDSKNPATFDRAYENLKTLVSKINDYKKSYEEAKVESKEFKADMILDSVKNFLNTEVVEGMQTKPLATIAKCGAAAFLMWKLWGMAGEKTKDFLWKAAGVGAGLYILNGVWPHLDPEERKLSDYVFGAKSVDSPAYRWFLQQAGIENNDKIDAVFAVSDFKIDKMIALYRNANNEEINIDDLIDSTTDTETITKLQKLNTQRNRKALYVAISELIELGGYDSPGQLLAAHRGEPLRSVVLSVYAQKAGSEGLDMADAEKGARDKAIEKKGLLPNEEKVKKLLEIELAADIPDHINVEVRDNKVWVDGYPYNFDIKKTADRVDTIVLKDIKNNAEVATLAVSSNYNKTSFVDTLGVIARYSKAKVASEFVERSNQITSLKDFEPKFDSEQNAWNVKKKTSGGDYEIKSILGLGLKNSSTIPLNTRVSADGYLNVYSGDTEIDLSDDSKFNESLIAPKLADELSGSRGPEVCRGITNIEVKKYDKKTGVIEAKILDVETTIQYDKAQDKYLLSSVEWEAPNNQVLEFYQNRLQKTAKSTIETGLSNVKFDEVEGFPDGLTNEFNKLRESKPSALATLYKSNILELKGAQTDIEGTLAGYEKQIGDDLANSLGTIVGNYRDAIAAASGRTSGVEVTEEDFKKDFLDILHTAGLPSPEYKAEYQALMDNSFYSGDFSYSVAFQKYSDNFYEVKDEATRFFFEKTGQFALKKNLTAGEKGYIESVAYAMNQSLREAFMDSNWVQKTAGAAGGTDVLGGKVKGAYQWITENAGLSVHVISLSELNWREIEPYDKKNDEIYKSGKAIPVPIKGGNGNGSGGGDEEKNEGDGGSGSGGGGGKKEEEKTQEESDSPIDDDPSEKTKELVWAEYERYINSRFHDMEKDVDKIVYVDNGGGFMNLFGFQVTNEAEMRVLFKALINTKKREFLDYSIKSDFDRDYDALYQTWEAANTAKGKKKGDFTINTDASGKDINPVHILNQRYFEPMEIDLQTMSTWLGSLGKDQKRQPTTQDYERVVEKFLSSRFGKIDRTSGTAVRSKEFELLEGMPSIDATLDDKARASREKLDQLDKQIIIAKQALDAEGGWWAGDWDGNETDALAAAEKAYDTELKTLSTITSNPRYSGLQNLYRFYVRTQVAAAQEKANGDESKYVDYFATISSYDEFNSGGGISDLGSGWTGEALTAFASKALEDQKDDIEEIDPGYDLEQFMKVRYNYWVSSVNGGKFDDGTPYSPGLKLELLNDHISCEKRMLEYKKQFWDTINSTATVWPSWLAGERLADNKTDLATYEKALHTSLMENGNIPSDQKVIIYRESLNYTISVLEAKIESNEEAFKAKLEGLIDTSVVNLDSINVVDVTSKMIEKIKE